MAEGGGDYLQMEGIGNEESYQDRIRETSFDNPVYDKTFHDDDPI